MAYIPGSGLKKPLNMMETPVFPDIRKAPPRFVDSGKAWKVSAGQVLLDTQDNTQFYSDAILPLSRNSNDYIYGVSSGKTVVNKAFRPPLRTMEDDLPLSRQPRPAIVPRLNPTTTTLAGNNRFETQNETKPDMQKYITDKVKDAYIRPTMYLPMSTPVDNSVLPDLELKRPTASANSGARTVRIERFEFDVSELKQTGSDKRGYQSQHAGYKCAATQDIDIADIELDTKLPSTSFVPNATTPFSPVDIETKGRDVQLFTKLDFGTPKINPTSGMQDTSTVLEFGEGYTDTHLHDHTNYSVDLFPRTTLMRHENYRSEPDWRQKKITRVGPYTTPNKTSSQFQPMEVKLKSGK
jgi:hypothetical protein